MTRETKNTIIATLETKAIELEYGASKNKNYYDNIRKAKELRTFIRTYFYNENLNLKTFQTWRNNNIGCLAEQIVKSLLHEKMVQGKISRGIYDTVSGGKTYEIKSHIVNACTPVKGSQYRDILFITPDHIYLLAKDNILECLGKNDRLKKSEVERLGKVVYTAGDSMLSL